MGHPTEKTIPLEWIKKTSPLVAHSIGSSAARCPEVLSAAQGCSGQRKVLLDRSAPADVDVAAVRISAQRRAADPQGFAAEHRFRRFELVVRIVVAND